MLVIRASISLTYATIQIKQRPQPPKNIALLSTARPEALENYI